MYKVLIVDDETYICTGLQALIKRLDISDISEIYTATDYDEAALFVRQHSPEIIITDIMMPEVSGIELIRRFKNILQDARYIVLSGYNEFSYVKEAFKLGISDYIMKPAEKEEMQEVLEKVIKSLETDKHTQRRSIGENRLQWRMLLENSLNKLFYYDNSDEHDLNIEQVMRDFFGYEFFSIGILNIRGLSPEASKELTERYVFEIKKDLVCDNEALIYCFRNHNNDMIFVFNFQKADFHKGISEKIRRIVRRLKENEGDLVYFSLSDCGKDIFKIRDRYQRAEALQACRILTDKDEVVEYDENSFKNLEDKKPDIDFGRFETALREHRTDDINKLIDSLFTTESLKHQPIEIIEKLYEKFVLYLGISIENGKLLYTRDLFREFSSFKTLEELRRYIKASVSRIDEMMDYGSTEKSAIVVAKKFIHQNYCKDIDMAMVANIVSMNYTYFSKIFKDETGMNFMDYLMETRMEEAKRLLKDPSQRIYEISARVGYANPKHFMRAFKKLYSITPEQYRKNGTINGK